MPLVKGIISFPTLFVPKVAKGATDAKFGISVLIPPNDPQVAALQAEVQAAKLNGCPSGYNGADECFNLYDTKYAGKDYYDPRFSGWWVFSCSAKETDRPSVVDINSIKIIDPSQVYSGMVAYVHAGISYYPKGKAGIGGWLNGVMMTAEEPPMGRLDNKPSVEQMFAGVAGGAAPAMAPPPAQAAAPQPLAPPPVVPVTQSVPLQMTALAQGVTLETYLATPGWTEQMLLDQGLAIRPSFV